MRAMVGWMAVCALLTGCDASLSPVPKSDRPWRISGVVIDAKTGSPLSGQAVSIHRFQRAETVCFDCRMTSVDFVVTTDADGRFSLSGQLPGQWGVGVHEPKEGFCSAFIGLGRISNEQRHVVLKLERQPCPIVL